NVRERGELLAESRSKIRMSVDARSDCGSALGEGVQTRLHGREAFYSKLDLRAPSGELLAERHRHCIHQMRPPGFHDRAHLALLRSEHLDQMLQGRYQLCAHTQ